MGERAWKEKKAELPVPPLLPIVIIIIQCHFNRGTRERPKSLRTAMQRECYICLQAEAPMNPTCNCPFLHAHLACLEQYARASRRTSCTICRSSFRGIEDVCAELSWQRVHPHAGLLAVFSCFLATFVLMITLQNTEDTPIVALGVPACLLTAIVTTAMAQVSRSEHVLL